jgi:hypothetical protein
MLRNEYQPRKTYPRQYKTRAKQEFNDGSTYSCQDSAMPKNDLTDNKRKFTKPKKLSNEG